MRLLSGISWLGPGALMVAVLAGCDRPTPTLTPTSTPAAAQTLPPTPAPNREGRAVELQGHRGARGMVPENTIPGFLRALELGAETLELDVVVSADRVVVVSHEPWLSAAICTAPDGAPVEEAEQRGLNIYKMLYADVRAYDCGSRGHESFPSQAAMATVKPSLAEVFDAVDAAAHNLEIDPPWYNVELKSSTPGDNLYHPAPDAFVLLVRDLLEERGKLDHINIQSFDPRILEAMHELDHNIPLALLVGNEDGLEANLGRLTFTPEIYSPNHQLVNAQMLRHLHGEGVRVIPWTVNQELLMRKLIELGVDGLITDYPDLGRRIIDEMASEEPS